VVPLVNQKRGTNEFEVTAEQLKWALEESGAHEYGILAWYHSHVAGVNGSAVAIPSDTDRQFMVELAEAWPGVVHVILDHDGIGVWGYDDGVVEIGRLDAETD
jgi:proteasome lid subunit RPN8/RPN11